MTPEQYTLLGLAAALAGAGVAKIWVFGWTYQAKVKDLEDMTEDRNFWRDIALKSTGLTDRALNVASKVKG